MNPPQVLFDRMTPAERDVPHARLKKMPIFLTARERRIYCPRMANERE